MAVQRNGKLKIHSILNKITFFTLINCYGKSGHIHKRRSMITIKCDDHNKM